MPVRANETEPAEIAVRINTISNLFNSFDPSPFREKDFDADVEAFVVGWVRELPEKKLFKIVVYLPTAEAQKPEAGRIGEAFAYYFNYRARIAEQEMRELFRLGRRFLGIGVFVLTVCLLGSQIAAAVLPNGVATQVIEESLIIVGWVANWRPIEIYLYDWVPIRRKIRIARRIASAKVTVRTS